MKVSEAISLAYLKATGKTELASTDAKYTRLLKLANFYQQRWQNIPGIDWESLYQVATIGPITQSTNNTGTEPSLTAVDMDSSIRKMSQRENDSVVLLGTDGTSTWYYDIIQPTQLTQYIGQQACAKVGTQLVFSSPFLGNDARIGASVLVPGYGFVSSITKDTQTIQVDDPMWLVLMMAAEFVRTDLVRRDQYPNILGEANEVLTSMVRDNDGQRDEIPIDMSSYDLDPNQAFSAWY